MLNLAEYQKRPKRLADYLPWAALVAPGIVLANPPWGARIGERKLLFALYGALGQRLADGFKGWRVGLIAPDAGLVKATGLALSAAGPTIDMGGTRVTLWQGTV